MSCPVCLGPSTDRRPTPSEERALYHLKRAVRTAAARVHAEIDADPEAQRREQQREARAGWNR